MAKANVKMYLKVGNDENAKRLSQKILKEFPFSASNIIEQRYWKIKELWEVEILASSSNDTEQDFELNLCQFFSPSATITIEKENNVVFISDAHINQRLRFQEMQEVFVHFERS